MTKESSTLQTEDRQIEDRENESDKDEGDINFSTKNKDEENNNDNKDHQADKYIKAYENVKPRLPTIIDQLLEAPSILDSKIELKKRMVDIPQIPEDLLFENEEDRKVYEVIYRWQYQLEKELREEEKNFNQKIGDSIDTSEEESGSDESQ